MDLGLGVMDRKKNVVWYADGGSPALEKPTDGRKVKRHETK